MSDQDDRLQALFQDAAGTPPAAGFSYGDVTRASGRITRRRRMVLSGAAAVAVVLAGTGVVVASVRDQGAMTSAASAPAAAPGNSPLMAGPDATREGTSGGAGAAPLGPGTAECADRQDPALRALLDQALPEVAGATAAASTDVCLPGSERYVTVEVAGGVFGVSYLPPGTAVSLVPGAVSAPTASGGTVIVHAGSTRQGGGPAPFADREQAVLEYLAPRL